MWSNPASYPAGAGYLRLGPDIAGYENMAGFRPGPDVISGATLLPSQSLGYGSDK